MPRAQYFCFPTNALSNTQPCAPLCIAIWSSQAYSVWMTAKHTTGFLIAKGNKPVAKLVAIRPAKQAREPGSAKGEIWIAPDFDESLEDFKDYMP